MNKDGVIVQANPPLDSAVNIPSGPSLVSCAEMHGKVHEPKSLISAPFSNIRIADPLMARPQLQQAMISVR